MATPRLGGGKPLAPQGEATKIEVELERIFNIPTQGCDCPVYCVSQYLMNELIFKGATESTFKGKDKDEAINKLVDFINKYYAVDLTAKQLIELLIDLNGRHCLMALNFLSDALLGTCLKNKVQRYDKNGNPAEEGVLDDRVFEYLGKEFSFQTHIYTNDFTKDMENSGLQRQDANGNITLLKPSFPINPEATKILPIYHLGQPGEKTGLHFNLIDYSQYGTYAMRFNSVLNYGVVGNKAPSHATERIDFFRKEIEMPKIGGKVLPRILPSASTSPLAEVKSISALNNLGPILGTSASISSSTSAVSASSTSSSFTSARPTSVSSTSAPPSMSSPLSFPDGLFSELRTEQQQRGLTSASYASLVLTAVPEQGQGPHAQLFSSPFTRSDSGVPSKSNSDLSTYRYFQGNNSLTIEQNIQNALSEFELHNISPEAKGNIRVSEHQLPPGVPGNLYQMTKFHLVEYAKEDSSLESRLIFEDKVLEEMKQMAAPFDQLKPEEKNLLLSIVHKQISDGVELLNAAHKPVVITLKVNDMTDLMRNAYKQYCTKMGYKLKNSDDDTILVMGQPRPTAAEKQHFTQSLQALLQPLSSDATPSHSFSLGKT